MRTPVLVTAILKDVEAGDSERTAVIANGLAWPTWSEWKAGDPELDEEVAAARERGNRQMMRDLMALPRDGKTNRDYAKIRLHLLACRVPELRVQRHLEHSGTIGLTVADLMAQAAPPDLPPAPMETPK